MTKLELRKKLIEHFETKEVDYDSSQNTMTLYRWAKRHTEFIPVEEFEPVKKEEKNEEIIKEESTGNGNIEPPEESQLPDKRTEEKKPETERKQETQNTPEIVKIEEKEPEKTDNSLYWILAIMAILFVGIALYNYVNGRQES